MGTMIYQTILCLAAMIATSSATSEGQMHAESEQHPEVEEVLFTIVRDTELANLLAGSLDKLDPPVKTKAQMGEVTIEQLVGILGSPYGNMMHASFQDQVKMGAQAKRLQTP